MTLCKKPNKEIIQIVNNLNCGSGVMNVIMNYYRLMSKDYIFIFLYYDDSDINYMKEIYELGGYVEKIDRPSIKKLYRLKKNLNSVISMYKNIKYIHIHVPIIAAFFICSINMDKKRFIIHSHSNRYSDSKMKSIRNWLLILPVRLMNICKIACSEEAGKIITFPFQTLSNLLILQNAIDYDKFLFNQSTRLKMREKLRLNDEFVLGHVGRLSKEKNHIFMLDLMTRIIQVSENIKLIFIGNGEEKYNLLNEIKKRNLSKYIIMIETNSQIFNYLQAMDLFLFPSLFEGLGMSLIEAQAAGLKCIASTNVPEETCISNQVKYIDLDVNSWVNEILRIKEKGYKRKFYYNINKNKFDIKYQVKKLEDLYDSY